MAGFHLAAAGTVPAGSLGHLNKTEPWSLVAPVLFLQWKRPIVLINGCLEPEEGLLSN